jgi:ribonuclease J
MKFIIHRGTKEIGGSCVEVMTATTRIVVDLGMPLMNKNGGDFDFSLFKNHNIDELIKDGVLPAINGLYGGNGIDGMIISHPHQDHYGLSGFINPAVPVYMGEATHRLIEINNLFTSQNLVFQNPVYFQKNKPFTIGDITITPYWADHSAFDAYSFLIESEGTRLFYSGDFRGHGRKAKAFKWFTHNAPQNVDYLLLEGTSVGRGNKPFITETAIEEEFVKVFREPGKINLIQTSGQNIDRIVSIFRACVRTGRLLVVDVYVATILKELSRFAAIPFPSKENENLKVMFPRYTSRRLKIEGNEKTLYQFRQFKITKEEISKNAGSVAMIIRPSMQKDLEHINGIDGGNLIYSMWDGYLQKPDVQKLVRYLKDRGFSLHHIHTSGHADLQTLEDMINAIRPEKIVPIHTFYGSEFPAIFGSKVVILKDGQINDTGSC